ncbi:unnamed protein product [Phaeothamnion confervicola]
MYPVQRVYPVLHCHSLRRPVAQGGVLPCDVVLRDQESRGRALHGDFVAVQLLPVAEWRPQKGPSSAPKAANGGGNNGGNGIGGGVAAESLPTGVDAALAALDLGDDRPCPDGLSPNDAWRRLSDVDGLLMPPGHESPEELLERLWRPRLPRSRGGGGGRASSPVPANTYSTMGTLALSCGLQPVGKVIGVLERGHKRVLTGTVVPSHRPFESDTFVIFRPTDRRMPLVHVPRHVWPPELAANPARFLDCLLTVRLADEWPPNSSLPLGEIESWGGRAGDIEYETDQLLLEHGIDHGPFPAEALAAFEQYKPLPGLGPAAAASAAVDAVFATADAPNGGTGANGFGANDARSGRTAAAAAPALVLPVAELAALDREDLRRLVAFTIDPSSTKVWHPSFLLVVHPPEVQSQNT